MLIANIFGHQVGRAFEPHPQVQGVIGCGVEIELENIANVNQFNSDYWVVTTDGSLRNNGREFIFNGPRGGAELFMACVELDSFLAKQNPDANWRCSAHVHLDMRWATVDQLKKTIVADIIYEKFLFRMSGMERYRNNFCAAFGFAQDQINILASHWNATDENFVRGLAMSWDKYSALNLKPLSTFGSIEFRSSSAEWRKGKLVRLCNRFLGLVEYATSFQGTVEEMINELAVMDPRQIMPKGFQKAALPEGWQEDISTGVKLAHDLLTFARIPMADETPNGSIISLSRGPFVPLARDNARWVRDTLSIRYGYTFTGVFRTMEQGGRNYTAMPLAAIRAVIREHNISANDFMDGNGMEVFESLADSPDVTPRIQPQPINAATWAVNNSHTQAFASLMAGGSLDEILQAAEASSEPVPVVIDEDEDDEFF